MSSRKTITIRWQCQACKHRHKWTWPAIEKPKLRDTIQMVCDNCCQPIYCFAKRIKGMEVWYEAVWKE